VSNSRQWWKQFTHERYWLEVTDRPDIGVNLKAPTVNEKGKTFWGYSFVKEVNSGDIIFHYDKNEGAIIGRSVASGIFWTDIITWAARGTYARAAGIQPHSRDGIYFDLATFRRKNSSIEDCYAETGVR
jgi:hypothetical protein